MSDVERNRRKRTRLLVIAELVVALAYGILTGFQVEGSLIDAAVSVVLTGIFLIWLSRDAELHEIEIGKIQKVLFFLVFTAPVMVLWYGIKSRRRAAIRFLGKMLGVTVCWLLVFSLTYLLIGLFVTHILRV